MKIIIQKYPSKNYLFYIFLLSFLSLLFWGCAKEQKIKEKTFVKIYADLVIAQDSLAVDSVSFANEQNVIFTRYNVTKKLYVKTLDHYKKNPDKWKSLFEEVIAYLREKEKKKL